MGDEIRWQRGSAARLSEVNPVLGESEPCHEKDTGRFKVGDGVTPWNDLPYYSPDGSSETPADLNEHIQDPSPHPVYDNGSSLILLYENAKV